ncbi:DEP domain-containing protein 7 [Trichinella murrelli]|uniref:DEP domain-containing protein 7 n=1 Tax=Trichinella murrelli TaxID=144512 RepID=A0A0V0UIF3_9BILA|nr:DEP domain-containing protein 7 [Trichinella murrelli]
MMFEVPFYGDFKCPIFSYRCLMIINITIAQHYAIAHDQRKYLLKTCLTSEEYILFRQSAFASMHSTFSTFKAEHKKNFSPALKTTPDWHDIVKELKATAHPVDLISGSKQRGNLPFHIEKTIVSAPELCQTNQYSINVKEIYNEPNSKPCRTSQCNTLDITSSNQNEDSFHCSEKSFHKIREKFSSPSIYQASSRSPASALVTTPKTPASAPRIRQSTSVEKAKLTCTAASQLLQHRQLALCDFASVQEKALQELLQIVEIPMVDGILLPDCSLLDESCHEEKNFFKRYMPFSERKKATMTRDIQFQDTWLNLAVKCLPEFDLSNFKDILNKSDLHSQRIYIYDKVRNYFKKHAKDHLLLPAEYEDIVLQISSLASKEYNFLGKALKATQLMFTLLPPERRKLPFRLLEFLAHVCTNETVPLNPKESNENQILHDFKDSFFKCTAKNQDKTMIWIRFAVANWKSICEYPNRFENEFLESCRSNNKEAYCSQITKNQYQAEKCYYSATELVKMIPSVMTDNSLTSDEKLTFLTKFKKEYPELYNANFHYLNYKP